MREKYVIANFKMNKTPNEVKEYTNVLKTLVGESGNKIVLCVPFVDLFTAIEETNNTNITVSAQNMYFEDKGAFTGEISPKMLSAINIKYVLVGHSERRQYFHETDEDVNKKLKAAFNNGIIPILCIGEALEKKEQGKTAEVLTNQLKNALEGLTFEQVEKILIAYEPLWAISTNKVIKVDENGNKVESLGFVATKEVANETIKIIRDYVLENYGQDIANKIIILYGGSVKESNFKELFDMPDIDGGLVGGACLNAEGFAQICNYR